MKLLVVLIALLLERHWDEIYQVRRSWPLTRVMESLANLPVLEDMNSGARVWVILGLVLLAYYILFGSWVWGLLWGIIGLFMLIYSMETVPGRLDFEHHLKQVGNMAESAELEQVRDQHDAFVGELSDEISRGFFPALFWFVLAGPMGILIYLVLRGYADWEAELDEEGEELVADTPAHWLLHYLEWIPARIHGLVMALLGDFSETIGEWMESLAEIQEDPAVSIEQYTRMAVHPLPEVAMHMDDLVWQIEKQTRRLKLLFDRLVWGWLAVLALFIIVLG